MTTITLVTNDQALSVVLKPLVASGDYNLVKVQVEFDSAWERYPVRSAVFRTQKGAEAEILLTDNECIIPYEVLTEPGTLFIAMRGVTYSGNVIKTTEEVKYKVVQGAKDIASTTAPSHNMFAQYMAAIAAGIAPHITNMENKVDEECSELEEKYNATLGSFLRIEAGSYVGNGTWGADNPTTIEFNDIVPKVVFVYTSAYAIAEDIEKVDSNGIHSGTDLAFEKFQMFLAGGSEVYAPVRYGDEKGTYTAANAFEFAEKNLIFHNTFTRNAINNPVTDEAVAAAQLNTEGATYYYIAIGA